MMKTKQKIQNKERKDDLMTAKIRGGKSTRKIHPK